MSKDVAGDVEGKGKENEDLDNSLQNRYVPKFSVVYCNETWVLFAKIVSTDW